MSASTLWTETLGKLQPIGESLMKLWGREAPSPEDTYELHRLTLAAAANAYVGHVYVDPRRPLWAPLWNLAFNFGGPNPDFVYMTTDVEPHGTYQISGYRGTSRFVEITQSAWEMLGEGPKRGVNVPTHDIDSLKLGPDGYFSVILSAERPAGYEGEWWPLHPQCIKLMMRKCGCDWGNEIDARVSINRLDDCPPLTLAEKQERMLQTAAWAEGIIRFDIELARYYRDTHAVNGIERSRFIQDSEGLPDQVYNDGSYDITDDEALIIDTALPAKSRYWQVLVANDRFETIDWINRQTSLNDKQAHIDPDGHLRAVVSKRDPGVYNWLDKADEPWGIMQIRWNRATDAPIPVCTKVPFDEIREHLPADTRYVTPDERKAQLQKRREAAQMRILW